MSRWRFTGNHVINSKNKESLHPGSLQQPPPLQYKAALNSNANRTVLGASSPPSSRLRWLEEGHYSLPQQLVSPLTEKQEGTSLIKNIFKVCPFTTVESFQTYWSYQQAPLLLSTQFYQLVVRLFGSLLLQFVVQRTWPSVLQNLVSPGYSPDKPQSLFSQVSVSLKFWLTTQKDGTGRSATRISINYMRSVLFCIYSKVIWLKSTQSTFQLIM